jgi:hypothetical protein
MKVASGGRGVSVAAAAVFALVLAVLLQLRYGYTAGTNDHLVLSLQGLQWAGHGVLVDDWFIRSAPQPHLLFDLVTWAGAASGQLSAAYLAWWLLGLIAGGAATAVLARAWTPRTQVLSAAVVAVVIGLGPEVALGSTTPALPTGLPHELGGFLAYLTAALLLTRRPAAAAVALVATSVVHVQIGALAAVVSLLAFVVIALIERRCWWWTLGGVVLSAAVVLTVLRLRPVAASGDDFVQICREVIPFHCDAASWPSGQLLSGLAVVVAALLSAAFVATTDAGPKISGDRALWTVSVLVPAVGLVAGVLADRYQVPVLGRLAQSTNIYRLAVLLIPFSAWGLVAGFHRLRGRLRAVWLPLALVAGTGWLVPVDGIPALPGAAGWAAAVMAVAAAGVLLRHRHRTASGLVGLLSLALLLTGAVLAGPVGLRPVTVTFVPDPAMRALGAVIAAHVPPGGVIQVPPTMGVIRLTAGRSVLVDCKAVPYGGPAWADYRARLEAIGGRGGCSHGGAPYLHVPAADLVAATQRYGARYLVLSAADPRRAQVQALGWRVLVEPSVRTGNVWLLAGPGAPDAGAPDAGGTTAGG